MFLYLHRPPRKNIVPLEAGREIANAIPGAEFAVIKGMGHDGSLKFTDEIVNAIVKHVSK